MISCKHQDSFKQDPLNALLPSIEELLDFGKAVTELNGEYNAQVLRAREAVVAAFRSTASGLPSLSFKFVYAS